MLDGSAADAVHMASSYDGGVSLLADMFTADVTTVTSSKYTNLSVKSEN